MQALDDAKIQWREKEGHGLDLARCGILVGTAMGGMQTFATACEDLHFKVKRSAALPLLIELSLSLAKTPAGPDATDQHAMNGF